MKHRKRNRGLILPILVILTALLACDIPSCNTTGISGDFLGSISNWSNTNCPTANVRAAISIRADGTSGQFFDAVVVDGDSTIQCGPTVYLHVSGPVINYPASFGYTKGAINESVSVASLTQQAVTGTVSYQDKPSPTDYIAKAPSDPPLRAGLYIAETTLKGVHYEAGWVVLPTGQQREAIFNKQTGALMMAPALTVEDVRTGFINVPDLGVFLLTTVPFSLGPVAPTSTATPTPSPITSPPMLSVSPTSFKLPGDTSCSFDSQAGSWDCVVTLANIGQNNLNWSASSNPPGVSFVPSHNGILHAGKTQSVMVSLRGYYCTSSTLLFSGGANPITVSVFCPTVQ